MSNVEEKNIIVENILFQAKYFLKDVGEFYPFGTIITSQDELRPLGLQTEEEFPKSSEMLSILRNTVTERIKKGEYKCAAIGVDVSVTKSQQKVDAIEVQFFDSNLVMEKRYYEYSKKEGEYEFELIKV